jgi:anti-anti-sigma factor
MVDRKPPSQTADGYLDDAPSVLVELSRAGYAAVVSLHGEHDLSTRDQVEEALAGIFGSVLVDLSACPFIDSTVIVALIAQLQERVREGHRLELVVPPGNTSILRIVEVVGLRDLLVVHDAMPPQSAAGGAAAVA